MDENEHKAGFLFAKPGISPVTEVLGVSETFVCQQGTTALLLNRLTYPRLYSELIAKIRSFFFCYVHYTIDRIFMRLES